MGDPFPPRHSSDADGPTSERPTGSRGSASVGPGWLVLLSGLLALALVALGIVAVLWTTARTDLDEARVELEEVRDELETARGDLETAGDEIQGLEGRVDSMSSDLTRAKALLERAKTCIRGIGKALRSVDLDLLRSVRADCNAVVRARTGGGGGSEIQ